mgnify:FL=1
MDLFTQIKMAVPVKEAAEYYGLEVNRGNMVCCPFHNDRTPSMKLNEGYFYCFGCGATGDVIDLVARLFNLSSYDVAKKLAYDFGIDPDKPPSAAALRKPQYPLAKGFRERNCTVGGYYAIICIFWSIGRCSTHPKHRRNLGPPSEPSKAVPMGRGRAAE